MKDHKARLRVHVLLHPELGNTYWDRILNAFIIILILLNVIVVMLETVPSIYNEYEEAFQLFDITSVAIFSIEYILRVWSSIHDTKYAKGRFGRLKYILSPGALIDLLAILPFYLHVFIGLDLRILRMLRLFRFFRLFRLTAYMKATKLVVNVFKATYSQLMLSLLMAITLIIISSSFIYFAEHNAQPNIFRSIPSTLWWSVVTLTTVGYGDMIPITMMGKIFTSIVLFSGVALFALPAGILTAGFLEETKKQKQKQAKGICPHCLMPLDTEVTEHAH